MAIMDINPAMNHDQGIKVLGHMEINVVDVLHRSSFGHGGNEETYYPRVVSARAAPKTEINGTPDDIAPAPPPPPSAHPSNRYLTTPVSLCKATL